MSNSKTKKSWNVSKATRDAVVGTADRVQMIKQKTTKLAHEVQEGFKQGVAEVQKKNKNKKKRT